MYSLQKLARMIFAKKSVNTQSKGFLFVKLGNLLSAGSLFGGTGKPIRCICSKVDYKPDLEFGFFEHDSGLLLPKTMDISLELRTVDLSFITGQ